MVKRKSEQDRQDSPDNQISQNTQNKAPLIGFAFIGVVILIIGARVALFKNPTDVNNLNGTPNSTAPFSLPSGTGLTGQVSSGGSSGKYQDSTCNITFSYPTNWAKSDIELPLIPPPISQNTFDEPVAGGRTIKKSIFSYMCFDASKMTAEQILGELVSSVGSSEIYNLNNLSWERRGNYVYTTSKNKLIVLEMFFTKYDATPLAGYEEIFQNIIKSVKF